MVKPYYKKDGITIYHGDCRKILPELKHVDLVLTDPPYGLETAKNKRANIQGGNAIAPSRDYGYADWDNKIFDQDWINYIINMGTFACIWGGNYYENPPSPSWLVWDKQTGENTYADCELAWTNYGCAVRLKSHLWKGMFREGKEPRCHPTQKPLKVIEWAIILSPKFDLILDPFMGSGTTLLAAKQLNRKAIGIEIEEKYCKLAVERLEDFDKRKKKFKNMKEEEQWEMRIKEFGRRSK